MLIILTSAKTMTGTSKIKLLPGRCPVSAQEANEIALNMAQFSTDDLKKILETESQTGIGELQPVSGIPYRRGTLLTGITGLYRSGFQEYQPQRFHGR